MKLDAATVTLLLCAGFAGAQEDVPVLRLVGVSTVDKKPVAFIEVTPRARAYHSMPGDFYQLQTGERVDALEVLAIDTLKGVVKVRPKNAAPEGVDLKSQTQDGKAIASFKPGSLHLENAPLTFHVDLLGRLAKRTVLHGPLAGRPLSLHREGLTADGARKAVEEALAKAGFKLQQTGERFVVLSHTNQTLPALPKLEPDPAGSPRNDPKARGPTIRLVNAPLDQVLHIYGDLAGAEITRQPDLPAHLPLSMNIQTELSRRECQYALETMLLLNGVKLVRASDGTVQAMPAR